MRIFDLLFMSSTNYTGETVETNRNCNCTYWVRDDDRDFLTDPHGKVVNLARLTAYAEYGESIHDAHAHHEIPLAKINAPEFIDAISPEEHHQLDHQAIEEANGIPVIRADP
jgi:hypothetical protein